jgi:hypothetical protein
MKELAVQILLGWEFIDDHVTSIRSKDKTIQMNSGSVIPLYRRLISKAPTPVYLAQHISLAPFSEINVPVATHNEGTLLIQGVTTNREFQKRNFAMATGMSVVKTSQSFMLKVANYRKARILLPKHTTFGIATALSTEVLTFPEFSVKKPRQLSEFVNEFDWKEELQVDHLSSVDQNHVLSMLSKHSSMWKGSLGEICITKHHIELQSAAKPVYQPPYRAGVQAREVEKKEVDRTLAAGVIEPSVS